MISFEEAQQLIERESLELNPISMPTQDAVGLILAQQIKAPINLPPFDNSAVDGFAVNTRSLLVKKYLPVATALRACPQEEYLLASETTAKIMTGAPVPHGADAVVMKEHVRLLGDVAYFSQPANLHDNIRFRGEDINCGDVVFEVGDCITPQVLAVLLGLGIARVIVFKPPSVAIIATGDELVQASEPLKLGQVYYLVGPMLKAQCAALGVTDIRESLVADNEKEIDQALEQALDADVVLLSGGMSKGDHDFVRPCLARACVREVFYQGAWRPGKPLYFGQRNKTRVFGLPGNPVAAFVCFHLFVRTLIARAMKGQALKPQTAILQNSFEKKAGFTFFLRAMVGENNDLTILPGQGSHQIFSLSRANALCVAPASKAIVKAGEVVQYYPI